MIAYVAATHGKSSLWVRPLESASARNLAGTEGAIRRTLDRLKTPILAQLIAVVLAVGLHTTPLIPGLAGFIGRLFERPARLDRSDAEVSIDLDLDDEHDLSAGRCAHADRA